MWAEACALLEQAERKHRHFFDLIGRPRRARLGTTGRYFRGRRRSHMVVALPGARVDDSDRPAHARPACRSTHRVTACLGCRVNMVRLEVPYGRMRRRIELPAGRYVLTRAQLGHGYLQSAI